MKGTKITPLPWLTPAHYSELKSFTYPEWAWLLSSRLGLELLLQEWEIADPCCTPSPPNPLDPYECLRATLDDHFKNLAATGVRVLGGGSLCGGYFPNIFLNEVAPPVRPLTVGEAILLTPEILRGLPRAAVSVESLQSVMESGFVLEASGVREPSHIPRYLNSDERRQLGRPVNNSLLVVDLGLDRRELLDGFAKWLEKVRPGGRASMAKKKLDLAGWVENVVVPYVDLDHWLRWSGLSAGPTQRAEMLKPFFNDRWGTFDPKKLSRTVRSNSEAWLSEATLSRLNARVAVSVSREYGGCLDDQTATEILASRGVWYRSGQD